MDSLFDIRPGSRAGIVPRCYQLKDHDHSFRLWDQGELGVLTRSATGTGKTVMACLKMDTWLRRGDEYRAMVISYETQLVWQFAQEIEDVLGIRPGIEMDQECVEADAVPKITVVSRASLLRAPPPTPEQVEALKGRGIETLGACPARLCKRFLSFFQKGGETEVVLEEIERVNRSPEAFGEHWSRLHKFHPVAYKWLLIFDEAHRHAYHLASVGHIVDWFDRNHYSRRNGITATPKRGDEVSLGHKMFPAVALDYPLYSPTKPCAVKDGYAVPYVQKYIEVEGVDFKTLAKVGEDFDEAELEKKLGEEETLAKLVMPLLDLVGERRTLIFSPGVEMAKNVARFINARAQTKCQACGIVKWHPRLLIGDGAACECGAMLEPGCVTKDGEQARELDGASPEHERKQVYKEHQAGRFQFLSVCGLCREGYNDPDVACVAIFRPVSKKASSLAEQMKGRACRPLRGLLDGLTTKEERLAAIAASSKPYALIVDLVGVTGLADCASTVQIYGEGLPDEILERAEVILADEGLDHEMPVEDAIEQAKREDEDARERVKQEREAAEQRAREDAERRAKAGAEVSYSEHEVGIGSQVDSAAATEKQYNLVSFLGMIVKAQLSKKQLGRIINMLRLRTDPAEVAFLNRLGEGQWEQRRPSLKQLSALRRRGVSTDKIKTPYDASLTFDALKSIIAPDRYKALCELGRAKRNAAHPADEPLPE
jgi:superfamily II DNA or RNA helicase